MTRFSLDTASDPFAHALAPPPNESGEERAERERMEAEAKRISDGIDEDIKAERAALKRKPKPVKVLLLGQSESGKSTTLKNFQLMYAREHWKAERASWRTVIQLNLIRSINAILDLLASELADRASPPPYDESDDMVSPSSPPDQPPLEFTERHRLLKMRLVPLRRVEADLKRRLGAAAASDDDGILASLPQSATPFDPAEIPGAHRRSKKTTGSEFCVRSWKNALEHKSKPSYPARSGPSSSTGQEGDEATDVIASCREDMKALWEDAMIQLLLVRRKFGFEHSAGFFLNDIDRIATRTYEPSDDDVIRARLRTLGVQEHRMVLDEGPEKGQEWILYDVGGSRTMRPAWVPFFDDINAIIFLAPISCFDERLAEDPSVNRLEDTFLLWRSIVSSKLLAKTQIIIFLNKYDLLERKVRSGVQVKKYMTSYGDRENSAPQVVKYLGSKFKEMQRQLSPEPRPFYGYTTSVINTKATAATLRSIRDGILRDSLKQADFV